MVKKYLSVFIFGMVGGLLRLLFVTALVTPIGTVAANLLGCFLFPLVVYLVARKWPIPSAIFTGLSAGFVASLTTFSSLNLDSLILIRDHHYFEFVLYISINVIGGLLLSILGRTISDHIIRKGAF